MDFNKASRFSASLIPWFSASARKSVGRWFEAVTNSSRHSRNTFAVTPRRKNTVTVRLEVKRDHASAVEPHPRGSPRRQTVECIPITRPTTMGLHP